MKALDRDYARHPPKAVGETVVTAEIPAGVVGMGLMGTSIAACLLIAGHPVAAVDSNAARRRQARLRLREHLQDARREGVLKNNPANVLARFKVSGDFAVLANSQLVVESVFEDLQAKRRVIRQIEEVVSPHALIASNTSSLPITQLQKGARHPERILGIHWGEPAHILRFMEIICGRDTAPSCAQRAMALARRWGKEPALVRRDIRGFITNRIMYAMLREAFHLVESGYATVEDVDRSVRNDYGYWMTLAGPFRYMDLTGIPAYAAVMKGLLPELSCNPRIPALMKKVVRSGALGVANARGFYRYTPAQAKRWEKLFLKFSYDIRALAQKYPEGAGD
jgi:3-hydroxybutyryl-CoA dehydrogenase